MKKVAVLQSNYLPWKGYIDLINAVDEFIIYDCAQYTKRDWRNKNYIKSPNGKQRLTVPIDTKGKYYQKISEAKIIGTEWKEDHWKSFFLNYKGCKFLYEVASFLEPVYFQESHTYLSQLNYSLLSKICNYLKIKTKLTFSSDYQLIEGKAEKLISLCQQTNANVYVSGPSAKNYIKESSFEEKNITVQWMNYSNYPEYPQKWGEFIHNVSILDLLFNLGSDCLEYIDKN